MRSTKTIILLIIALGCGLIFTIGISQVLGKPDGESVDTETIFVAAANVPSYSKLSSELVRQEEWPTDKIPQGAVRSIEEFDGLSPRYPLVPGEPIVLSKLSSGNSMIAAERIPVGHQVLAVKVDKESALGGLVNPGDKVDILVFIRGRSSGADQMKTSTRTILRNITVFAVNDQMARDPDAEGTSIDAKTVSLLVLPEQSERLLLAKQLGTISLALRKPGDTEDIDTDGAQPSDLLAESQGSDGKTSNTGGAPQDGVFGILQGMQAGTSTAVDTSTEPVAPEGGGSQMVIMSPEGVMGTYTFTNAGNLPDELLNGGNIPSSNDFDEEELDAEDDASSPIDALDAEVGGLDDVLDPSDLGL